MKATKRHSATQRFRRKQRRDAYRNGQTKPIQLTNAERMARPKKEVPISPISGLPTPVLTPSGGLPADYLQATYEKLTKTNLLKVAASVNIRGRSTMTKDQLVQALVEANRPR